MRCQPPRSPDLNVLDLGFFASIQALQYRKATYDTVGLIEAVQNAIDEIRWQTLDKCFVTLQKVMEAILVDSGGNGLKLPRVGKHVAANGRMPLSVKVSEEAVMNGYSKLRDRPPDPCFMLPAMAAFAGMQDPNNQMVLHQDQSDQLDRSVQLQQQQDFAQNQQLIHHRRLMMQDEITLASSSGLQVVQDALAQSDVRAKQHAAEMEHRFEMFMHSTHDSLSGVETRLQERLEHALREAHTDVLSVTSRDIRNHIAFTDERVGQVHLLLEAALESYQVQVREAQESTGVAHLQVCQSQLSEEIVNTRQSLEDQLTSKTNARILEARDVLQHQIASTRDDAFDNISLLEARMQAKLDEVASNSAGACDEFMKRIDHATQELVQLVGDKVCASEAHALGTVDQKVTTLEEKMHHNLEAAMAAAECRADGRLGDIEARISENIRSMEYRVQGEMQTKFNSNFRQWNFG
ncbi:unnamed protein product [Phytophthora fragariaefolia]|uniref:Unnamed protein product n=1 Tax=Phytophthora fragariaefolia TaxID=1490495 RepID=A0A9W7D1P7_9STRA|nr:unnamed protein product [Phytophthora fragariaefolia]